MAIEETTRIVNQKGEIVAEFSCSWYPGHVLGVVEQLKIEGVTLHVETNAFTDDGTFEKYERSAIPYS